MENVIICNCKQVSVADIEKALKEQKEFSGVEKAFEEVQKATRCSTGCGGCYHKVLDFISETMN